MALFSYASTQFHVETTRQEETLRCAFRDANNKLCLELALCPNEKSVALCHLKKSRTCSGTFVFRMGLKFAKQTVRHSFVIHVWDSSMVDKVHLGVLNLLRNKPTYYERLGFAFLDQEAIRRAKSKASFLALLDMQEVRRACWDLQAQQDVQEVRNVVSYVAQPFPLRREQVSRLTKHLEKSRCMTFGQFVLHARDLRILRDLFDLSDVVGRSTTFFGLLFDLKLSYPSQLFLKVGV